jgi:hypothetical protein
MIPIHMKQRLLLRRRLPTLRHHWIRSECSLRIVRLGGSVSASIDRLHRH